MKSLLAQVLSRSRRRQVTTVKSRSPEVISFCPPAPERPLAVIGDVHGMSTLFERMLENLAREAPEASVLCVGDLVDRGENSAEVLRRAWACSEMLTVLLGNHEEMLLSFLDAPTREGPRWLRNGGLQTLASFGVGGVSESSSAARLVAAADELREKMGDELERWLRGLPRMVQSGNIVVTHAGADPWRPISQQSDHVLTWGHRDFGQRPRTDGLWIVHGHTIVPEPVCDRGQISVDTGAYAGNGLTAALISVEGVRFLRV
ncbi:serine/threonine protein phosphatase 1 [Rhodobacter sp. JA431]|uniref:metallophosphoesterase n=1 Tax=Rhodobacter sp. JA431 TaxID=570013 RepID=UPI000BC8108A|nr:serine/threonine protein phosphatase 1 [Rhodobacter sp. JA431]